MCMVNYVVAGIIPNQQKRFTVAAVFTSGARLQATSIDTQTDFVDLEHFDKNIKALATDIKVFQRTCVRYD